MQWDRVSTTMNWKQNNNKNTNLHTPCHRHRRRSRHQNLIITIRWSLRCLYLSVWLLSAAALLLNCQLSFVGGRNELTTHTWDDNHTLCKYVAVWVCVYVHYKYLPHLITNKLKTKKSTCKHKGGELNNNNNSTNNNAFKWKAARCKCYTEHWIPH